MWFFIFFFSHNVIIFQLVSREGESSGSEIVSSSSLHDQSHERNIILQAIQDVLSKQQKQTQV